MDAGDETVTHTLLAPNATNILRTDDRLSSIYFMHASSQIKHIAPSTGRNFRSNSRKVATEKLSKSQALAQEFYKVNQKDLKRASMTSVRGFLASFGCKTRPAQNVI